ncbi:hypothetical protein, partial [Escherichia coli]|uniref:hypothetical protein n=1 Tax=Escherichia coli TaxID=562 RepID=UPI0019543AAB
GHGSSIALAMGSVNLTGHLEELQLRGLDPRVRVLALETRPMIAEVAEALQRSPGAEGWYLE